jgi:hypothetical protein
MLWAYYCLKNLKLFLIIFKSVQQKRKNFLVPTVYYKQIFGGVELDFRGVEWGGVEDQILRF